MTADPAGSGPVRPPVIDTTVAHPARRYNYWLGGKDNFAADRASGDRIAAAVPSIRAAALANRAFLHRAVRHLAAAEGVEQFLDIGTGIPASPNVHEVAQDIHPDARIVYVDNDPIVLSHARALMVSRPEGRTAYIDGDLRNPAGILTAPALLDTLDLTRPVALLLIAVLHFLPDDEDPYACVRQLLDALPSGSFLAVSHATVDPLPQALAAQIIANGKPGSPDGPFQPRTADEVRRYATGLRPVAPGLVSVLDWHPDEQPPADVSAADVSTYALVAAKP